MGVVGKASRKVLKAIGYIDSVETSESDRKLLETIRKHVELDNDATDVQRELELDDLRYCDPNTQWSDSDRAARESEGRPCLTEDRLGPFITQVCNEQRKNRPAVQVNPVDGGGDLDTAEVIQGLIRHIEYNSNADAAYDTAFESAVRVGRGFYRICTDYVDEFESDNQEIQIKMIEDPHMVFIDPAATEVDFSDARWGGIKKWLSEADFKDQFPGAKLASVGTDSWKSIGDDAPDWMNDDGSACLVVEYFWKEEKEETVERDGKKHKAKKTQVKWVKCTAVEILERGDFAARWIPIIPVLGKMVKQNGKRTWAGLIRAGKDPQKRFNYLLTAQAERVAFIPLSSWLAPEGAVANKRVWNDAHKRQMAILEYKQTIDGQPVERPTFISPEAGIVAITRALEGAEQGLKGTLGMYDPTIGNRQGSESGVAIQRLQAQGETGNYHFQDNLGRAQRHEGRIILDLLKSVYDTERVVRVIGDDGTQQTVKVNGPIQNEAEAHKKEATGKIFDMTTGKYDVTISSGPSYQSKRQEDRAFLLGMIANPAMGQLVAMKAPDLIAKTMDSPIARDLAKRLTPPEFAESPQGGAPIPPQVQQQMAQMQQQSQMLAAQHEQLVQALHDAQDQIDANKAKAEAEMAKAELDARTKLEIAQMSNEAKILIAEAQISGKGSPGDLKSRLAQLETEREELAELVLSHHEIITNPAVPEPVEPEEPKEDPLHGILQQHGQALDSIGKALHRLGGPKRIVTAPDGTPIGTEPMEQE
jgi:hypothetical protein